MTQLHRTIQLLFPLVLVLTIGTAAQAQSPTPNATVENKDGTVRWQSFYGGGLLAPGTLVEDGTENDSIPATGAGTRMMWYPEKAAFRAGRVFDNPDLGGIDGRAFWNASNVGKYSVAFGQNSKASGLRALAIGRQTTASGEDAVAIGDRADAGGGHAVAIGLKASVVTNSGVAIGTGATSTNFGAVAIGGGKASGQDAAALNDHTIASSSNSLTIGECNSANTSSDGSLFVVGNGNFDGGDCDTNSDALVLDDGGNLEVSGSFILPDGTTLDESSDVGGLATNSNGASLISNDDGLVAPGTFGSGSIPIEGAGTRMMWYPNKAAFRAGRVGDVSGSEDDWNASNVGNYSVAFGKDTKAGGEAAVAMGSGTDATARNAAAMGSATDATAAEAVSMGAVTTAATSQSLSIGECNSANTSGDGTLFAAGNGTFGLGVCSRSDAMVLDKDAGLLVNGEVGTGSIPASGSGTRMMWYPGKAAFRAGEVSGSQWDDSNVGKFSMALGANVKAGGEASTALGGRTQAETDASLSIGRYNDANTSADNTLFVVGNGSSGNRSDALTLDESGNFSIDGVVNNDVGGGPAMHFRRGFGGPDDDIQNYVTHVENNEGSLGDVLAIQGGETDRIDQDVNMIGFFDGDGDPAGRIEGDGLSGTPGVQFESTGSDYAEELPIADGSPKPEATDLVGVRGGEASLDTDGADRVMIVSTAPIMLGNSDLSKDSDGNGRVEVAFIGQVPTRVRGPVETGDLIVASGKNDGTARAVTPEDYQRVEHGPIAGQAWSAKSSDGIGEVTVAVGLGRSGAVAERLEEQRKTNRKQQAQIEDLKKRLAVLEADRSSSLPAGLTGPWALAVLLGLGGLGAGLLWRRRT